MISSTHLHAMVIHFPIALLMVGFVAEIASFIFKTDWLKKTALSLLVFGSIGAIVAYVSGSYAGSGIESGPLAAPMELHENAALITMILAITTALYHVAMAVLRYDGRYLKVIGLLLYGVLVISVARTGFLGGQLVFNHGAGVHLALPDFNHPTIVD